MPLELKQQRILVATIGRTVYRYTVRPIAKEEWLQYFDSVSYEQELVDKVLVNSNESTGARLELLGKVLLNVEGYETEHKPITEIDGWYHLLPISHRSSFADLLFECGLDPDAAAPAMLGAEKVTLRARWSADPQGKGIVEYRGLEHVFRVPSIEQSRRYSRDSSRSEISGGRKGKTRFLGAQRTLVDLYDELIVRVAGYTVDGRAPEDLDTVIRNMDTFHKAQAMGSVFAPAGEAELENAA